MKSLNILVGKDGRPSMKGVYAKMQTPSSLFVRRQLPNREYFRKYDNHDAEHFVRKIPPDVSFTNEIVVRWGNRIEVLLDNCIVYNKAEAIARATNKKLSRKIFLEKGVNTPKLFSLDNYDKATYPIIARPIVHAKGKNFVVLNNDEEFAHHIGSHEEWYYSEFIDKVQEFRVHCGHGKILNLLEKPKPEDKNTIAWNRSINGEAFLNVKWNEYNYNVTIEALKAIEALGLDFGGVDVILDAKGKAYVLEVNTSPTLASSEYSMTRYALYFDWLNDDKRKPHWDFRKFKEVKSLAWKNLNFNNKEN